MTVIPNEISISVQYLRAFLSRFTSFKLILLLFAMQRTTASESEPLTRFTLFNPCAGKESIVRCIVVFVNLIVYLYSP